MTNRRPKPQEIEELPTIHFQPETRMTFGQAKEEIMKQLSSLPPLNPDQVRRLTFSGEAEETVPPEHLECNINIVRKLAAKDLKLEEYSKKYYQPQFVFLAAIAAL